MRITRIAIEQPHWIIVFALLTLVLGVISFVLLPKDILPPFKTPAVQVLTLYPGMPSEVVEKDITTRLERWTGQSNGIARQESRSMTGVSVVRDFFRPDIDANTAMSQVTSLAMSDLYYLPPGTIPPMVMPFDPTASVPLVLLTVEHPQMNETQLYDVAYFSLRNMLQGISGVIAPAVYGGTLRRILAYVDPDKLAIKQLSGIEVVEALRDSNVLIPTGNAKLGEKDYQIVTNAMVPRVEEMTQFLIRAANGVPVRVGDVATVEDSHQIQTNVVRVNGKRQVYIPIYRQPGANTIEVVNGIKQALASLLARLPSGLQLHLVADQSVFVRHAIQNLTEEVAFGGLLAAVVVVLFLGSLRASLATFLAIPLSILACGVGLYLTGDAINVMTLGGMALAVGRLIDDSIVVLENILRHGERGESLLKVALTATTEVGMPVLAATLTTIIIFLPVVFLTGIGKFLFTPLAKSVSFSIMASYIVSMTVIPLFCVRVLGQAGRHIQPHAKGQRFERFAQRYEALLRRLFPRRAWVLGACGALFIASLGLYPWLGKELFPRADVGHLTVHLRLPTGTRIENTEETLARFEQALPKAIEPEALRAVITNIGVLYDWPAAYTPNGGPHDAFVEVELADRRRYSAETYAQRVRELCRQEFPDVECAVDTGGLLTAALNMGAPAPIVVQIGGKDLQLMEGLAEHIVPLAKSIPGAVDVRVQEREDYPQVLIDLDREKIAALGLTVREVVQNIVTATNSSVNFLPAFWIDPKNGNHYFIGAQYPESIIQNLETLKDIPLTGKQQPRVVRLKEVATFKDMTAPAEVRHLNIRRVVNVLVNTSGRDVGTVAALLQQKLRDLKVPEGYDVQLRGEVASMSESFSNLGFGLALAILLVYLLLVGQFRSFLDPLLILMTVPFGLIGVMITLWMTHTTLNVQSFIGIIFMVGIAVSNGILLIEFANRLYKQGQPAHEAAVRAARIRLRPILMTSIATVFGLIPMAIGIGHGSEANVSLARAVLGGLTVSTVMTLIVLPLLYGFFKSTTAGNTPVTGGGPMSAVVGVAFLMCFALGSPGLALASDEEAQPPTRSLEEVTAIALEHHPEIRVARAQLEEQTAGVTSAYSGLLPRVNLVGIDSRGLGGSSGATGISGVVNSPFRKHPAPGIDGAWTLFDAGTFFKWRAAQKSLVGARHHVASSEAALRLVVAEAYGRCASAQTFQEVLRQRVSDQETLVKELESYATSGLRSPVELNLGRATLEGTRVRQITAHAETEATFAQLLETMGVEEMPPFRCQIELPSATQTDSLDDLRARALAHRPEIAEADAALQAAHQEWLATRSGHIPRVVGVGSAGFIDQTRLVKKQDYSFGIGIVLPVFDGFRIEAEETKARAREAQARAHLDEVKQRVTQEVRSAYAQFLGVVNAVPVLERQLELAEQAYQLARKRYAEKTGSFADLRDAQSAFDTISEQHVTAMGQFVLAYRRLIIVSSQVNTSS